MDKGKKIFYKVHQDFEIYVQKFWVAFFVKHPVYKMDNIL